MADEFEAEIDAPGARARILEAASKLIAAGGVAALTTRAVAAAAGVQTPTLYRLFGDKRGLLAAVAERGLSTFMAEKTAAPPHPDPAQNLRDAWDVYVAFGIAHPAVFAITNEVGALASRSPAMLAGIAVLRDRVERVARAGRLRVPVERAVALIHAAGVGTVTTLLAVPEAERDLQLSPLARDAVLAAVCRAAAVDEESGLPGLAVALRSHLGDIGVLTPGERLLLGELLARLSEGATT